MTILRTVGASRGWLVPVLLLASRRFLGPVWPVRTPGPVRTSLDLAAQVTQEGGRCPYFPALTRKRDQGSESPSWVDVAPWRGRVPGCGSQGPKPAWTAQRRAWYHIMPCSRAPGSGAQRRCAAHQGSWQLPAPMPPDSHPRAPCSRQVMLSACGTHSELSRASEGQETCVPHISFPTS